MKINSFPNVVLKEIKTLLAFTGSVFNNLTSLK